MRLTNPCLHNILSLVHRVSKGRAWVQTRLDYASHTQGIIIILSLINNISTMDLV